MSLDARQRRAVEAGASVAVVAGAGTGKTHMLARRYLHHLRHHDLRPLQVVAVTFTRRAADELRARIRAVLAAALADGDERLDPDALHELEAAPIGTIHALAQRVTQAFPAEAGLPPDATVLDELDGRLWTAEALDAALDALTPQELEAMPFSLLKRTLQRLLEDPYRAELALAKDAQALRRELDDARRDALAAACGPAWSAALATVRAAAGPADHPAEEGRRAALAAVAAIDGADAAAAAEGWQVLSALRSTLGRAGDWRALGGVELAPLKAALRTLRDAARDAWNAGRGPAAWSWGERDERMLERTAAARSAFARVRADLAERKRRARLVDFGDLELHALRALEHEHVRAALHRRWRALLVDEFQDTSPAQARLLELLRDERTPVTVVGDEKQSIYAFRGADVRVFRDERRRLGEQSGADSVALATSYRTHRALVEVVNRVFDTVLGADAAPLAAARDDSPLPPPYLRRLEFDGRGASSEALARAEAERVAGAIAALLDADPPLQVEEHGALRPLRAGDVAVLARSRASLEPFEALAPRLGVPVLNAGGGDVLSTPEGRDALALLGAVTDPSDTPALVALLRGPFVAASDTAIHALAAGATRGRSAWWQRLGASHDARLRAGAALLDELRARAARGASAAALLAYADEARGYRAVITNLPNGQRRLADWQGVVELVQQLEGGAADPFALRRRLERLRAAQVAVPRPPLRSRDAVTLMSIHGAKGLEWPVVVVLDLARRPRAASEEVLIDPDLGVTLRWREPGGDWLEPALFQLAERRGREREAAEDARLAYVALTRARDVLLLSARAGAAGLSARLAPGLDAAGVQAEVASAPDSGAVPAPPPLPPPPPYADDAQLWGARLDATEGAVTAAALPLPEGDPYRDLPLFAAPDAAGAAAPNDWSAAAAALAVLDEDGLWSEAARLLRAAGLPAPEPSDVFVPVVGRDGVTREAVARWRQLGGRPGVALVPLEAFDAAAAPDGWRWLPIDPLAPGNVLGDLADALGVA